MNAAATLPGALDPLRSLPRELIQMILDYLEPADILRLGLVNRSTWSGASEELYRRSARAVKDFEAIPFLPQDESTWITPRSITKSGLDYLIRHDGSLSAIQTAVNSYREVLHDGALDGVRGCWLGREDSYLAPLLLAAQVGRLDVIDYLLDCGANLNIRQRLELNSSNIISSHLSHRWLEGRGPDYGCRPHVDCDGTQISHRQCLNALDIAIISGQDEAAIKLLERGIVSVRSIGSRTSSLEHAFLHGRIPIIKKILTRPNGSITPSELFSVLRTLLTSPRLEGENEVLDMLLDIEANDPQFSSRPLSMVSLVNTALSVSSHDFPCAGNALRLFQRLAQQDRVNRQECLAILGESLKTVRGLPLAQAVLARLPQIVILEDASLLHFAG
ncbi:hypothetical protein F5X96DRAFT_644486 [Biscogniauxia mediterranea]|nr:hypothetical protein F5X96DRAFT_644486 [Biscogniauxia mediterranea]